MPACPQQYYPYRGTDCTANDGRCRLVLSSICQLPHPHEKNPEHHQTRHAGTARYQIIFRATRYAPSNNVLSLFHPVKAKQVALEYIKIAWFYLYHFIAG